MKHFVYFGTYTRGGPGDPKDEHRKQSIFVYSMDTETGELLPVEPVEGGPNAAYLNFHPNGKFLYAANELSESFASAFAVDRAGGGLRMLNSQPTQGTDSCYVTVSPSGRWLLLANYSSGSVSVLTIGEDGQLGPLAELVLHQGRLGPNSARQERTHAHSVIFDPTNTFTLVADLGMDRVMVYRLDEATGHLEPNNPPGVDAKPGAGPRHMAFHPNGRLLYVANELDSSVAVYAWDAEAGTLEPLQALSTLPENFSGENTVADIHITPGAGFLYVSNRGHNSVAAYRVDGLTGLLTPIGITSSGGNWPRNFAIDPEGNFLLVANQYSSNVVLYRIAETGDLIPTGKELALPVPVCIKFL